MTAVLSELAKGISFLLSVVSLYALLGRALFLLPGAHWQTRLPGALEALALAASLCFATGLLFILTEPGREPPQLAALVRTLPIQLFFWTAALGVVLFLVSGYLEEHYVPLLYRNQPHEMSVAPRSVPAWPLQRDANEV
jgi:cation transport ATPase